MKAVGVFLKISVIYQPCETFSEQDLLISKQQTLLLRPKARDYTCTPLTAVIAIHNLNCFIIKCERYSTMSSVLIFMEAPQYFTLGTNCIFYRYLYDKCLSNGASIELLN